MDFVHSIIHVLGAEPSFVDALNFRNNKVWFVKHDTPSLDGVDGVDGVVVVFSLESKDSLTRAIDILIKLKTELYQGKVCIVGNNADSLTREVTSGYAFSCVSKLDHPFQQMCLLEVTTDDTLYDVVNFFL